MKFVIQQSELNQLIRKIQNIVPQNAPIPILSHVLVEAVGSEIVMTATDLTVGTQCRAEAKVYENGAITIPSKRFFQLIRELTDANIEMISVDGEMVEIKAGSSRFLLHGMDKTDYPELPDFTDAHHFTIESETLKSMLYRTAFAVAKDDSRYALTGVLMRIENGQAQFIGTDGKRLANTHTDISLPTDFSGEYILPIKAVDEMLKILGDSENATLYFTNDKIAVETGNTRLTTKLLASDYPDCSQIMNTQNVNKISLHREELITLLRQISLFTTDTSDSVCFTFVPGELVLTANCVEVGEGKVSMPANYEGTPFSAAFNPHFFLDILRHSKDETLSLAISDAYNPGVITDSTNSLFIIMPMRLKNSEEPTLATADQA